jgi:hypothetical protein
LIDGITFVKVDSTNRLAIQARVKELVRIFHLSTLGECQPDGVLEGIANAEYAFMRPHGDSLGLLPGFFHFTSSTKAGSACLIKARSRDNISPRQSAYFLMMASIWLRSRLVFHRHLFLVWLLQHYSIAIFPCGLKDNLALGGANPVHGKARLLFSKHANVQNGAERNLMESCFSRKICPSAHDSWQFLRCESKICSLRQDRNRHAS